MRDVANVGTLTPRTGFVIATGVVLATLVTTLPLLHHVFDVHIGTMLKSHAPTHSGARDGLRSSLQFLQAVLSVALLIGAGLFVQSLRAAEQTRIGLDADRVLLAEVDLGPPAGEIRPVANDAIGNDPASRFWREALARVSATRNVESAALAITTPLRFAIAGTFRVPGREKQLTFTSGPYRNGVTAGYFSTIGARLLRGRDFAATDARTSPRVVILNQTLARASYRGVDPIGQCVRVYRADSIPCATIVGVVEDVRRSGLEEETTYQYYMPLDQWIGPHSTVMMVRARDGTTKQVVAAVRSVLQSIASSAPFPMVQPMSDLVEPHLRAWRLGARAFTIFGGLAFLVAIVGLYGLISYGVQQRRFEFGIRSALGAGPGVIVRLVLWRGLALMVAGVVGGVGLAMFAGRWLGPLLFHVSPRDPSIYAVVIGVAIATALAALAVPARRASRVDPALALRSE
jgi:predicted permease